MTALTLEQWRTPREKTQQIAETASSAGQKPEKPGIHVWQLNVRRVGSSADAVPYPSKKSPFQSQSLSDLALTIQSLEKPNRGGAERFEVSTRRVFLPRVQALIECYCENCGVMTASLEKTGGPDNRRELRKVSACRDCQHRGRVSF